MSLFTEVKSSGSGFAGTPWEWGEECKKGFKWTKNLQTLTAALSDGPLHSILPEELNSLDTGSLPCSQCRAGPSTKTNP